MNNTRLVFEESKRFEEIKDEDGFPCEDVSALTEWVKDSFDRLTQNKDFEIKAVNFSGYGASFVYLDKDLNVIAPLYNYLKPYTPSIYKRNFIRITEVKVCFKTNSITCAW